MALILKNAVVITENEVLEEHFVRVEKGEIVEIDSMQLLNQELGGKVIDLEGKYLAPGFIDIHTHGAKGKDIMDGTPEALAQIANYKLQQGTTGFLATTLTAGSKKLLEVCEGINNYFDSEKRVGNLLGVHLEGPHISKTERGAQNPDYIRQLSKEEMKEIEKRLGDKLKMITLAPEKEGAAEIIKYAKKNNIVAAAGHTNASWEEANWGLKQGISHAIHFFNGMKGLHHRNPGTVGAFLAADSSTVELIADGNHIHPAVINLVLKCKGKDQVILVTDSMRAAGMEDGEYELGGMKVIIKAGTARLKSGELAGSTANMNQILKNILEMTELNLAKAVKLMTITPARKLGLDGKLGSIVPGKLGNLIILNSQLEVEMSILKGKVVYNKLK